jgi:hypothetical protein
MPIILPIRLRQFVESFAIIDGAGVTGAASAHQEAIEGRGGGGRENHGGGNPGRHQSQGIGG